MMHLLEVTKARLPENVEIFDETVSHCGSIELEDCPGHLYCMPERESSLNLGWTGKVRLKRGKTLFQGRKKK